MEIFLVKENHPQIENSKYLNQNEMKSQKDGCKKGPKNKFDVLFHIDFSPSPNNNSSNYFSFPVANISKSHPQTIFL